MPEQASVICKTLCKLCTEHSHSSEAGQNTIRLFHWEVGSFSGRSLL